MYDWLENFLLFTINRKVGRYRDSEFFGGVLETSIGRIKVVRGIPIIMPKALKFSVKKIYVAYQQIPPTHWLSAKSDWIKYMRRRHIRILVDALRVLGRKRSVRVLVLGCGWGWEILALMKIMDLGRNYSEGWFVGCDISLNPLFLAKRLMRKIGLANVDFVSCPASFLPFKKGTFDLVTAIFGALDHSPYYWRVFREVSRVLEAGGVFVGTVINKFALDWIAKVLFNPTLFRKTIKYADHLFARIRIPIGSKYVRIPTHFFTILELKRLLVSNGFKLRRLESLFSLLYMNFKRSKFIGYEKLLSRLDELISDMPIMRGLGRYIAFIAKKK